MVSKRCEVNQASPATLVVSMADRAGDIQERLVDAMRREPGQRAEVIMCAKGKRLLAPGAVQRCGTPSIPRQAPDGDKEGGSQPTESSRLNRRVFLAPSLPMVQVKKWFR